MISQALTVTNDYKQMRVYLEKSSLFRLLNKNKQKKYNTETCFSKMKPYLTKQPTADRFSTSSLQIFIQGWAFQ